MLFHDARFCPIKVVWSERWSPYGLHFWDTLNEGCDCLRGYVSLYGSASNSYVLARWDDVTDRLLYGVSTLCLHCPAPGLAWPTLFHVETPRNVLLDALLEDPDWPTWLRELLDRAAVTIMDESVYGTAKSVGRV